jgi:hypothetical protein
MPAFRRSVDLAEACAFLRAVAPSGSAPRGKSSSPPETVLDPRHMRDDLSTEEATLVRNLVGCSVCSVAVTERCRDDSGTSAYLHEGRVRAMSD